MGLKEAYQDKMEAQLKEWQTKIDLLKAKADKAQADQKVKYYEKVETLRMKQMAANEKLKEIRKASEGAWEDLKAGMEMAWEDLKLAIEEATKKFK